MKKGDVLKGSKRVRDAAFHYVVFLEGNDDESFIGGVLTHSNKYKNNTPMSEEHFRKIAGDGKRFEFQFDNTHMVKGRFIKLQDWGPFEKIGELTEVGVKFVKSQINEREPILWDEYINNHRIYEK